METTFTNPTSDICNSPDLTRITNTAGTYALVVRLGGTATISVGRLGPQQYFPGYYVYLGSALGPGGLHARVSRHLRQNPPAKLHWHIDYLLRSSAVSCIWWAAGDDRQECSWSETLGKTGEVFPRGFGSSDCRCAGHLIAFHSPLPLAEGRNRLRQEGGAAFQCRKISQGFT